MEGAVDTSMQMIGFSFTSLLINILYALIAISISVIFLRLADKFLIRDIDTIEELKKGNTAVAIVVGFTILSIALVIGMSLR